MMRRKESAVLLIYDIVEDSVRNRVAETCKDFGLERVQYSAFFGHLDRGNQRRLMDELRAVIASTPAKVWLQPLSRRALAQALMLEQD